MKKILKYYLPLTIFLFALGVFFLLYMVQGRLAVLKYFAGELGLKGKGKTISKQINAVIKEDGIEQDRIKLFEDEGKIYTVFQETGHSEFHVLIVDKERKDIFTPLLSSNCYGLVFSRYLFQAECGKNLMTYFKYSEYNFKVESNDSQINFQLPVYKYDGKYFILERDRKFEIVLKGK